MSSSPDEVMMEQLDEETINKIHMVQNQLLLQSTNNQAAMLDRN